MSEEPDNEEGTLVPLPPQKQPPAGPLVNFNADQDLDLRPPLPSIEELHANGGRLLVTLALREMPYAEYLQTNHWQDVRNMASRTYGSRCTFGANCSGPLDVHHLTYDNRGAEKPEDVEILCRKHHQIKHDRERQFMRAQLGMQFNRPV